MEPAGFLQDQVVRLNEQLKAYQDRYPAVPASPSEVPTSERPWLTNAEYMTPLMAAYDQHLEKQAAEALFFKTELDKLRAKAQTIVEENSRLHRQLGRQADLLAQKEGVYAGPGGLDKDDSTREELEQQVRLLTQENDVLAGQQRQYLDVQEQLNQEIQDMTRQNLQLAAQLAARSGRAPTLAAQMQGLVGPAAQAMPVPAAISVPQEADGGTESALRAALQDVSTTAQKLEVEKAQWVVERRVLENDIRALQEQTRDAADDQLAAHNQIRETMELLDNLREERDGALSEVRGRQEDIRGLESRLQQQHTELDAVAQRRYHEAKYDGLRRLSELNDDLQQRERLCTDLQARFDRALRDRREAEDHLEQVKRQPSQDLECMQGSLHQLRAEVASTQRSLDDCQVQRDLLADKVRHLERQRSAEAESKDFEIKELQRQLRVLGQHADELRFERNDMSLQAAGQKTACRQLEAACERETQHLKNELALQQMKASLRDKQLVEKCRVAEALHHKAAAEVQKLQATHDRHLHSGREDLRRQAQSVDATLKRLKAENAALREEAQDLRTEGEALSMETERLHSERVHADSQASELQVMLYDAETRAAAQTAQIEELLDKEADLVEEVSRLRKAHAKIEVKHSKQARESQMLHQRVKQIAQHNQQLEESMAASTRSSRRQFGASGVGPASASLRLGESQGPRDPSPVPQDDHSMLTRSSLS